MKKAVISLVLMAIITVSGCFIVDTYNFVYRGENELWAAEYRQFATGVWTKKDGRLAFESQGNTVLTVTYKKDLSDLSSVKRLAVFYTSAGGGGSMTETPDNPLSAKSFKIQGSITNNPLAGKNSVINVTIVVDGKSQVLELKYFGNSLTVPALDTYAEH